MNYYGSKELAEGFRTVRKNTLVIANDIGENHYGFRPAPDSRTVANLLVHIAVGGRLQHQIQGVDKRTSLEGFDFMAFVGGIIAEEQKQRSKAEIISMLQTEGDKFAGWLASLSDDFLGQQVTMPAGSTPASKSRFEMILGVKEHEMHHRGQLMMIERMVGVVPHLTRDMQARMAAMAAAKK
jgi:uncharacterized damage-inducible protein DinB